MPGPHNANIRGNWIYTKIWALSVDFFVVFLLFSSITGITLWYYFKNERAIGLIALFIGFLSIVSLDYRANSLMSMEIRINRKTGLLKWNLKIHIYIGLYLLFFIWLFGFSWITC